MGTLGPLQGERLVERFEVEQTSAFERLDRFLRSKLPDLSRSKIASLVREGFVLVNWQQTKPGHRVKPGEEIQVLLPKAPPDAPAAEPVDFEVIFEDGEIAVVNKPAGLVVHCTATRVSGTLVNGLLYRFDKLSSVGGSFRRGIVHRLDKGTSGVMVVAKTDRAHLNLVKQFEGRKVRKEYVAIVYGDVTEQRRRIELPVSRNPHNRKLMTARRRTGRPSVTVIEPIERFGVASLVRALPATGRTHQIRVHLAAIGHPVVADPQYGGRSMAKRPKFGMKRQALHASKIGFAHPVTGESLEFEARLPQDITDALRALGGESA